MIKQFIYRKKNGQRRRVGVFVAIVKRGRICIGFSLCCPEDKFDADKGTAIAFGRAISEKFQDYPPSIRDDADTFAMRAQRYFKDANLFFETREG